MTSPQTRWVIAACWIVAALIGFFAIDASSARSWLYLLTVAFVPPAILFGLWHDDRSQSVADIMHGGRS
jgi:hypothetical protein